MSVNVDQGRNVCRVHLVHAGLRAQNARKAQQDRALAALPLGKNLQVLARNLHRLFAAPRVLVANHQKLRQEARAHPAALH